MWRLIEAGWRVRYQPDVTVGHQEPDRWAHLLHRRYRYGTSTAALGRRHPDNVAPLIIHPWYATMVAALLAWRPALAAAALAGTLRSTRRALRRAGPSPHRLGPTALDGMRQTWLGLGRYATQFAIPAVLATLVFGRPVRKLAAASLLAGPVVAGWLRSDRRLDPAHFAAAAVADDLAYGTGVLAGCVQQRTVRPLIPHTTRRSTRW